MKRVVVEPAKPIELTVASRSPHAVAYRIWSRAPGGTWGKLADGHAGGDARTHRLGPVATGTGLAIWVGLGGHPHTRYRVALTIGQDGRVVETGTILLDGETNGQGVAQTEQRVELA